MVTSSTFFRAVVLHLRDLPRKRRDMSWHVMQGRVKPKHDSCTTRLSWPARTAYDRQGNNGGIDARLNTWKEHEGTNCTILYLMNFNDIRWYTIGWYWLPVFACSFCMRMSSILEPKNLAARKNPTAIGWIHLQVGTETMPAFGPIPGMNKACMNNYIYIHIIIYIHTCLILRLWYPIGTKQLQKPDIE